MILDVNAPRMPAVALQTTVTPMDAEPLEAHCALCGQLLDPEPDGSEPVCTDCGVETTEPLTLDEDQEQRMLDAGYRWLGSPAIQQSGTTKATETTKRRERPC